MHTLRASVLIKNFYEIDYDTATATAASPSKCSISLSFVQMKNIKTTHTVIFFSLFNNCFVIAFRWLNWSLNTFGRAREKPLIFIVRRQKDFHVLRKYRYFVDISNKKRGSEQASKKNTHQP